MSVLVVKDGDQWDPPAMVNALIVILCEGDVSGGDKSKKGVKRKKTLEESGETAKRRSARVRNTKCKKEEKVDFQGLLVKFLPSRYWALCGFSDVTCKLLFFLSAAFFRLFALSPRVSSLFPGMCAGIPSVGFTADCLDFSHLLNTGAA